jgi:hypothetical protein
VFKYGMSAGTSKASRWLSITPPTPMAARRQADGSTFWFSLNTLVGSYAAFSAARRA